MTQARLFAAPVLRFRIRIPCAAAPSSYQTGARYQSSRHGKSDLSHPAIRRRRVCDAYHARRAFGGRGVEYPRISSQKPLYPVRGTVAGEQSRAPVRVAVKMLVDKQFPYQFVGIYVVVCVSARPSYLRESSVPKGESAADRAPEHPAYVVFGTDSVVGERQSVGAEFEQKSVIAVVQEYTQKFLRSAAAYSYQSPSVERSAGGAHIVGEDGTVYPEILSVRFYRDAARTRAVRRDKVPLSSARAFALAQRKGRRRRQRRGIAFQQISPARKVRDACVAVAARRRRRNYPAHGQTSVFPCDEGEIPVRFERGASGRAVHGVYAVVRKPEKSHRSSYPMICRTMVGYNEKQTPFRGPVRSNVCFYSGIESETVRRV